MKPTAITVCVNYTDFLAWSALFNRNLFKEWYVCTVAEDVKTIKLCKYYGLKPVICNFQENGKFNKFKGINSALIKIPQNEWIIFLDADILLPPIISRIFNELSFDKKNIYGCDRINLYDMKSLLDYVDDPSKLINDNWLIQLDDYSVGSRISQYYGQEGDSGKFDGWNPLGFFQMAHMDSFSGYPWIEENAYDHCDLLFSKMWPREKRIFVPEIIAIHIASERVWGQNWQGRQSKDFKETI